MTENKYSDLGEAVSGFTDEIITAESQPSASQNGNPRQELIDKICFLSNKKWDELKDNFPYNLIDRMEKPKICYWRKTAPWKFQMGEYECSKCGYETDINSWKYCPLCGNIMIKEENLFDSNGNRASSANEDGIKGGGTYITMEYAKKQGKEVYILDVGDGTQSKKS